MALITPQEVRDWSGLEAADTVLQPVIDAVEAQITACHTFDPLNVPADVRQALVMSSARLYQRRHTPEGVASFGAEIAIRVSRWDPDIQSLLAPYRDWVSA